MWTSCLRTMTRCLVAGLPAGGGIAEAQNAALDGPNIDPQDPASIGQPVETFLYRGAMNVYTTVNQRTAWTLETVLLVDDADPVDQFFGAGVALQGRHLMVAGAGALWIHERRKQG